MNRVLIIDDDKIARLALSENLKDHGFFPLEASGGREGIRIYQESKPPVVLLDLKMPEMDGIETMRELKRINPDVSVIIITAHGDIPTAVEATKLGAYDFITKPPDYDRLVLTLRRAVEKYELDKKVKTLASEIETSLEYLLGKSDAMKKVIEKIHQISQSDFSLIIQGETGTGKSFIARIIHNLGKRANHPFVTVDVGALPEPLVESELFGHEKGAFTGAEKSKKGFFEIANQGTLLIDELQNMSPYMQSKLLKAVEEKMIVPLGSTKPVHTDVRIIGATNSDILKCVREKSFREDLFYRFSEFMITLPPLRERLKDITFFAEKFLRDAAEDLNKPIQGISTEAMHLLENHPWPGNLRELKNVIRRSVLLSNEDMITPDYIEFLIKDTDTTSDSEDKSTLLDKFTSLTLEEAEKMAIKKVLDITNGNKSKAAIILKIDYTTLLRKVKQYCI
jgi:DNA-binding NtrC family response regulator